MNVRKTLLALAALALLAGCSATSTASATTTTVINTGSSSPPAPPSVAASSTAAPSSTVGPSSTAAPRSTPSVVTSTITRTQSGTTSIIGAPPSTPEPAPVQAECPYLSADVVSDITGQHHGPTQVVNVAPQPICVFYRSDGGWLASVRIIAADSPGAAVAAVNQHVPIEGSQPASQPAGWTGGSKSVGAKVADCTDCHSWYAVSKGKIAVVAEQNETPSIKARSIAICAIVNLKLADIPLPDYCTAG